jgi:hypothetical protein
MVFLTLSNYSHWSAIKFAAMKKAKFIAGDEYKSFELAEFVKELKEQPRYLNQFKPNGASGSGALPNPGGGRTPIVNPFKRKPSTSQNRLESTRRTLRVRTVESSGGR